MTTLESVLNASRSPDGRVRTAASVWAAEASLAKAARKTASSRAADALPRMAERVEPGERARVEKEVEEEIADAFAFAEASPFPSAAELMSDIFKED